MTGEDTADGSAGAAAGVPETVVDEVERLTRRARETDNKAERAGALRARERLLADHGFTARVRSEQHREVLVLYPSEWVEDGSVCIDRIDTVDRGVERVLSGAGDEDWATVEAHNRELARAVADTHGQTHGENAQALADFAGNHYSKRIETLTGEELSLFVEEYYPRNAWPTDDQKAVVVESLRLVFEQTDQQMPSWRRR